MIKRKAQETTQEIINYQLNWPIRLRELSIRLKDESHKIVRDTLKLYVNGKIDEESLREIIRLSGIQLSKYVNSRNYEEYDNEEIAEEAIENIVHDEEAIEDKTIRVEEEYVGESIIRRLIEK
ncbi:MAG: hypothetical protein TU36_005075 [Vulcanisaeta sp. AZ3]|nr:MAG: hypothetical protein TU36_02270 [Vulcanisaeta sp. AZ3]